MEKDWSMLKMSEGKQDPICVLGSGKAQRKPTPNKSLDKGKVSQVLPPTLEVHILSLVTV